MLYLGVILYNQVWWITWTWSSNSTSTSSCKKLRDIMSEMGIF